MHPVVLTTRPDSIYDDLVEERYHFPQTYLRTMERAVGSPAIYYEPRRGGGRQVYFAVVQIDAIFPDPSSEGHYYARVSNYLEFATPVPWRLAGGTFEPILAKADGSANKGAFGRAVRELPIEAFLAIRQMGLVPTGLEVGQPDPLGTRLPVPAAEFLEDAPRERGSWVQRLQRDRAFRAAIQRAYDNTCAVTGLRLVNGGGAAEIEAAHIHAVADGGPDSVRNGLALSRTIHWMFDRFLFTVNDDHTLRVPTTYSSDLPRGLVADGQPIRLPANAQLRPHPRFLSWHQERFSKKHGLGA